MTCFGADLPFHFAHRCFIALEMRLRAAALIVRRFLVGARAAVFFDFGGRPRRGSDEKSPSSAAMVAKDIDPLEIQEWINGLSKGLRSKLSEGSNPMKWVSATTVSDYEAVSLSPEESFAILERIGDPLVRVLVIVVAVTAIRIGEALGLKWSDIDWKKLKINIRRDWVDGELGRPKSRASKAPVEMHETLAALLQGVASGNTVQQGLGLLVPVLQAAWQAAPSRQHDCAGLHQTCGGRCRGDPGGLPEVRVSQSETRSFDVPDRQRTRSGGGAAHASPVACGHDDALRAQQPQGKERPRSIHRAFPAEREHGTQEEERSQPMSGCQCGCSELSANTQVL